MYTYYAVVAAEVQSGLTIDPRVLVCCNFRVCFEDYMATSGRRCQLGEGEAVRWVIGVLQSSSSEG
jgi:hypothetical protein